MDNDKKTMQSEKIPNFDFLIKKYTALIKRKNQKIEESNGIYQRYKDPIITAEHIPLHWRYDLNAKTNPRGIERIGFNSTFNPGAIKWNNRFLLMVRIEGTDRKSFFGIAESPDGINHFEFWDKPISVPQLEDPDVNVYDMRLIEHEDGWIYGIFCTERKDRNAPGEDTSAASANAGIIRTKDFEHWERLPDLISYSGQQRNVVLHPEFINGQYAVYTRPQDGFINVGNGGGIGLGYINDMSHPEVVNEKIINQKKYHTIYELKNGLGPAPIKTNEGWLHLAHGVRNTAGGLRYTLYMFMTDLNDISKVIYQPAGYLMAPNYQETVGDVPNVLFSNGWIVHDDKVYIYYASSDTRTHVAVSSLDTLIDYVINNPSDNLYSFKSVEEIMKLINHNKGLY
ncbi:glycosidase [Galbibacter orientalis]|uniref:glycoside hydrolase family 130 protein n=1 Tax=Galbibacter orientalis TaxID=453852 RepID=UPI0030801265